jgi:hypothetical protein
LGVERCWLTIPYQVRNTLAMRSFEHGNEPFCSIKGGKFFDNLRHYQLPMDYALRNELTDLKRSHLALKTIRYG